MTKRLFLLNGISILAVVASHAAGWAFIAMYYWADRYLPIVPPTYDPADTVPYYVLLVFRSWCSFAVPVFLFTSGFFTAYGARSSAFVLSYKTILARLKVLLIPFLVWSIMLFVGDALQGKVYRPIEYLTRLVLGEAHPAYFYIPLLCQFYLLAPLVIPFARTRPARLLLASAVLQLGALILRYLYLFVWEVPALLTATDLLFPLYAVPFSLGIVWGFHLQQFKQRLAKAKWGLLVALAVLAVLTVLESESIFRLTGVRWGAGPGLLSTSLYSIVFLLCYLAFDSISVPFPKLFYKLGTVTYGLYLLHPPLLEFFARATQRFAPNVLTCPVGFQIMLAAAAIGVALLFMGLISKSPIRKAYRYLFG